MKSPSTFRSCLQASNIQLHANFTAFRGTEQIAEHILDPFECDSIEFSGAIWSVALDLEDLSSGSFEVRLRFRVKEGSASSVRLALQFDFARWSTSNYLLMPAAAYNGNRFHSNRSRHIAEFEDTPSAVMPLTITDQQRLAVSPGPSRLDFASGDLATPGAAIQISRTGFGFVVLTEQATRLGNLGLVFEESEDRGRAHLLLTAPCVRRGKLGALKNDKAANFETGNTLEIHARIHHFVASTINALFEGYFARRNELRFASLKHEIPFSSCWNILEEKHNQQNWVEDFGYFSVGMRENLGQDWQTAWVGGVNTVYALLCEGNKKNRERAARTFDFLFSGGQFRSGFFRERLFQGEWCNIGPVLQRYSADALLFLMREFLLLEARGERVPERWREPVQRCADAFVRIWETQGQFGHRVDGETGVVVFGGTCSASTACGGLALAARFYGNPKYLGCARAAALHYHEAYVSRGITNGGPGDILQCPDSESAAGLLESFVILFEETGEYSWIEYARNAAHHCASWTMSYDFAFPPESTFGKMNMLTTGTVFANIQNKHSAPGICSLSGISLFKLYRATGDTRYLALLRDIAHAIPQFMSRADRPISDRRPNQRWPVMDPGWINERVNTSDWEVRGDPANEIGVGEIFGGSTWSEVAMMLTFAEIPGIYFQTDSGFVCAIDHVDARSVSDDGHRMLEVTNPTKFHASVKLFAETSCNMSRPLGPIAMHDAPRIEVPSGMTIRYRL